MTRPGHLAAILIIGGVLGLGSAWFALAQGWRFGRVTVAAWTTYPRAAGQEADPYSRAALARGGALPLAIGEGASFSASVDDQGEGLTGKCRYLMRGATPPARLWTMTIHDRRGRIATTSAGRAALTSAEILRGRDGSLEIILGASVEAGNWLPTPDGGAYSVTLNLYDTPISALGSALDVRLLPSIARIDCP